MAILGIAKILKDKQYKTIRCQVHGETGAAVTAPKGLVEYVDRERRSAGKYASAQQVNFELRTAERLFQKFRIPFVDTTEFSIEEIASRILETTGVERRVAP